MADNIIDKIRALLAKAESTTFTDEAKSLTEKATELMAKYAIDSTQLTPEEQAVFTQETVRIQGPYVTPKCSLLHVVAETHGCKTIQMDMGKSSRPVEILGRADKIEIVKLIFTSLLVQQANELLRTPRPGHLDARRFRSSFMYGYVNEMKGRFDAANKRVETEVGTSTALVLVDEAKKLDGYFAEQHPSAQLIKRKTILDPTAYGAGKAAAGRADIGQSRFQGQRNELQS